METIALRVSEPRELLSLIPHRLGFHPSESAVAVSLRPPGGRVGLVIRVDLPDLAHPGHGPQLAREVVTLLDRDGAEQALLVLYTHDDPRPRGDRVVAAAVDHVRQEALELFGDVPVWVVTSTGYLSLDCSQECCPPGGRPLAELASTQVSAQMVLAGSAVADSREDLGRIRLADGEARRAVSRVRRRWQARAERARDEGPAAQQRWRAAAVAAWRRAVDEQRNRLGGPTAAALGRVEAGLADLRVRDAVLVALVPGQGGLPERYVVGERPDSADDDDLARAVALLVDPRRGVPAPPAATRWHEAVLEAVVAHGDRERQAPALTLLGLLAWWRGDGARAQVLLERAIRDDAEYRLALLLADTSSRAVSPGWVCPAPRG